MRRAVVLLLAALSTAGCGGMSSGASPAEESCMATVIRHGHFIFLSDRHAAFSRDRSSGTADGDTAFFTYRLVSASPSLEILFSAFVDKTIPVPATARVRLLGPGGVVLTQDVAPQVPDIRDTLPWRSTHYTLTAPRDWRAPDGFVAYQVEFDGRTVSEGRERSTGWAEARDFGVRVRDSLAANLRAGQECDGSPRRSATNRSRA